MNKNEFHENKYDLGLKMAIRLCLLFIVLFCVFGAIVSPKLKLFDEVARRYDGEWVLKTEGISEKTFVMPFLVEFEEGKSTVISTILPDDIEKGTYLTVQTALCFDAYVDGQKIMSFDNNTSRLPGKITKSIIIPIPLNDSFAGKELSLDLSAGKYNKRVFKNAYIGGLMGIIIMLVRNYAIQFYMSILLVIASLLTVIIFKYIEKRDGRKAPLIYLAEGVLAISAWVVLDSPLFQFVFLGLYYDGVASFMLVIVMGLPILQYFDEIQDKKYHKIYVICESFIVINFITLTVLHLTDILSYDRTLLFIDSLLLVYIIVIFVCTAHYCLISKAKKHVNVIKGFVSFSLFSFLEIIMTMVRSKRTFTIDASGVFVLGGLVCLLYFAILDQLKVFDVIKQEAMDAIAATNAKSEFLANMSHEIRTPINAIMGMNEIILRDSSEENVKEYAKDVKSASEYLLSIVNDILDFSKIEAGKIEIVCDNYDLSGLILGVANLIEMKAEGKGLKLIVDVNEKLPSKLYGDDKRVREILTNILNNAVKYTDEGFVKLSIDGVISDDKLTLKIEVKDSGQGIKEEDLDTIFSSFSRVNKKKNKNVEGTGLGLTITKSLIEIMGGTISVESEYKKGSTFTVTLPQKIVSFEKIGDLSKRRYLVSEGENVNKKEFEIPDTSILVVDDTPLNNKVISMLLSKTKAEVTCILSGEEMLKLICERHFDLIFLDHMMPNMDGIETLNISKTLENNKCMDVPVIALTANAIVGAKEMYIEAGFDDYLSKPVKSEALMDIIEKYISKDKIKEI